MKTLLSAALLLFPLACAKGAPPQLTIYNAGFALVRESLPLDLRAGDNLVRCSEVTKQIDPGSVILRDSTGKSDFAVLEQKFSGEPLDRERMLALFEGETIPFRLSEPGAVKIANGKLVRATPKGAQPIVEVDGQLLFDLPGVPMFPRLPDGVTLRPELSWRISAKQPVKLN